MQKSTIRIIYGTILFIGILWFSGCDNRQTGSSSDTTKVVVYDTIMVRPTIMPTAPASIQSYSNRVKVKDKTSIKRVSICVRTRFDTTKDYDSLVLDIYVKRKNKSKPDSIMSRFAHLTFQPKHNGIHRASIRMWEKEGFSLFFTGTWYKAGQPEDAPWCKDSACNIPPSLICHDESGPVATVQSNTTSGSTATVSVDEQ